MADQDVTNQQLLQANDCLVRMRGLIDRLSPEGKEHVKFLRDTLEQNCQMHGPLLTMAMHWLVMEQTMNTCLALAPVGHETPQ